MNATYVAAATGTDLYVLDVEAYVNTYTNYIWTAAVVAVLDVGLKGLLTEASACICASYVINADMGGIGREEAQTRMDFLDRRAMKALELLNEKKNTLFIGGA